MTAPRLRPPFWQHDAYTLGQLAKAVSRIAKEFSLAKFHSRSDASTVVDLGAGEAPYRSLFESKGVKYLCCDIGPKAQIVIEPGKPLSLPTGAAQAVLSFQVLEHVWDLDWYLGEAYRIMADDGMLILSTHGTWLYHPHPTDFRRWTRDGLLRELSTRGFLITEVVSLVGPLAWTTQFRALGFHHLLSKLPIVGAVAAGLASIFFFLRMMVEDWITPSAWIENDAAVYVVVAKKASTPLDPSIEFSSRLENGT